MDLRELVELAGDAAELAGVALILGGLVIASVRYALARKSDGETRYRRYRHDLGRAILLGLEVLVAADIIRTVAFTPTMGARTRKARFGRSTTTSITLPAVTRSRIASSSSRWHRA